MGGWFLALRRHRGATWQNASDVKLPNADLVVVDRAKVVDYLLNEAHPDNGGKRGFSDCSATRARLPSA